MTKNKSLKHALVMSIISILVCSAMLVGATFAWFSDTVSTGVNTIVAGNLKVDIQDLEGNSLDGKSGEATLFNMTDVLWEPGMMFVSDPFVIANLGSMALQYSITTVMEDVNVTLSGHGLSEVISYKVAAADSVASLEDDATAADRAALWADLSGAEMSGELLAKDATSEELVVVLYWAPTAYDNLYNVTADETSDGAPLATNFSISVYATQVAAEWDGFGPGYDDAVGSFDRVHETVKGGVGLLNGTNMGSYAHLSDLITVGEDHYLSNVTLDPYATVMENGSERLVNIYDVYEDIGATLFTEITNHADDIYSVGVSIDDMPIDEGSIFRTADNEYPLSSVDIVLISYNAMAKFYAEYYPEIPQGDLTPAFFKRVAINELDGHSINVTLTTNDGIVSVYTLAFGLAAAKSEELASLHETLTQGVDEANGTFESMDLGEKIVIDPIKFVEGQYIAQVTFTEACDSLNDIGSGYLAISQLLASLVSQLGAEGIIAGVKVGGVDLAEIVDDLSEVTFIDLTLALAKWGYNDLLSPEQQQEIDETYADVEPNDIGRLLAIAEMMLGELDGSSFAVEFTDANGNSVSYTLSFSILAKDLSGELH